MNTSTIRSENGLWTLVGDFQVDDPTRFDELMQRAREVQENAYAPYSRFRVGAAALVDGRVFSGCNVENASYGGTMCAERTALFSAVAAGAQKLTVIAITTDARTEAPIESRSPCGLCRQVMAEFAGDETLVLLDAGSGDDSLYRGEIIRFDDLLPWRFRLQ
jgi:cytidine deaminase